MYGLGTSGVGGGGINRGEVEGIMVNEGSGGGGSEMFYVDYNAMQTVSVNAANNTAEMPQPGVLSQMVFKSGGNSYHGDLYFDFENAAMEGHDIDSGQIAALTAGGVVVVLLPCRLRLRTASTSFGTLRATSAGT